MQADALEPKELLKKLVKEDNSFVTCDCARIAIDLVDIIKEKLSYSLDRERVGKTCKISILGKSINNN